MAKIENTTVYPLTTPSADDFVIGTDTSNENRTVSFSISDITAAGGLQGLQSVLDINNVAVQNITLTGNIALTGDIYPTTITAVGTSGTSGQLLSSTATGIQWIDVPINPCCSLDDTLTVGNSTTQTIVTTGSIAMAGAGQALTLTGGTNILLAAGSIISTLDNIILGPTSQILFDATALIQDGTGSTGTIGQVLTCTGTGVLWAGVPVQSTPTLQEVLTAGDTAVANPINMTAASTLGLDATSSIVSYGQNTYTNTNTFSANGTLANTSAIALTGSLWDGASTGTASQVLTSTATGVSWSDVSAVGITDVNVTTPISATGPLQPITVLTPVPGTRSIRQNIYAGGSNIGCVPSLGTASTFLRGDGTWATPPGTGVTSVSFSNTGVASLGPPLVITPTTGAVVVEAREFAGAALTGVVPDSSAAAQTTTFLRADGTWQTPAGGGGAAPEWVNRVWVTNSKWNLANVNQYYIYPSYTGNPALAMSNAHGVSSPAVVALADVDIPNNILQANTTTTGCVTAYPDHKICEVEYSFAVSRAATIILDLWNTDIGGGSLSNATPVGTLTIAALAGTLYNGTFTLDPAGIQNILSPGKGVALTLISNTVMVNDQFVLNMFFKYKATA
jgi:hypothetical protein